MLHRYANDAGFVGWQWTTVKSGTSVKDTIDMLVAEIIRRYKNRAIAAVTGKDNGGDGGGGSEEEVVSLNVAVCVPVCRADWPSRGLVCLSTLPSLL